MLKYALLQSGAQLGADLRQICERKIIVNQTTDRRRMIIVCTGILFVFVLLCFCAPYALDDWFYGSSTGLRCMSKGFSTLNGRYLSNMMMMVFSRVFWLRALCMGAGSFGICYLTGRIAGRDNPALPLLAAVLLLTMSSGMFKANIVWSPGFVNYTFSPLVVLLILFLLRDVFTTSLKAHRLSFAVATFVLGAASCLIIEHVTIYMCMMSVVLLLYTRLRHHKTLPAHITLLIGCLAGTAFMFANPMYRKAADPSDSYYQMSFAPLDMIKSAYHCIVKNIIPSLYANNIVINLALALLLTLLAFTALSSGRLRGKTALAVRLCTGDIIFTAAYFYFCRWNSEFQILLKYTPAFEILLMLLYFASTTALLFLCVPQQEQLHRMLFAAASELMMSAPLLVVSPVADRCFTPMYVMRILLAAELADYLCRGDGYKLLAARARSMFLTCGVLFVALSLCFSSIFVYIKAADIARMDALYAQIEAGEPVVTLEKMPYSSYLFKGAVPTSEKWMGWFKDSHGIGEDVQIVLADFDGID